MGETNFADQGLSLVMGEFPLAGLQCALGDVDDTCERAQAQGDVAIPNDGHHSICGAHRGAGRCRADVLEHSAQKFGPVS